MSPARPRRRAERPGAPWPRAALARPVLAALALVVGCQGGEAATVEAAPAASGEAASAATRWLPVRLAADAPTEEQPARVLPAPDAVAVVAPALPARLDRVRVAAGDAVKQGDLLVSMTTPEATMASAVQGSSASLVRALERRREQLAGLRAEGLARSSDLFGVEVELARARAEQARAGATLGSLGPGGGGALRSPIDGVVIEVRGVAGEWWRPESGAVVRVASPRAHRVEATLTAPAADGSRFELVPVAGAAVALTLRSQAPRADAVGYLAWFDLPAGVEVPPAAGGRVRVLAPGGALVVAAQALGRRDGRACVAVRRAGARPEAVAVEVLRAVGPDAVLRGALSVGDQVAEDPYRALEGP